MARTKSNGNDSGWFYQDADLRRFSLATPQDTLLPKLLSGEIEVGKISATT